MLAVWLQWWVDANEQNPNARIGYWLGVFAGLACLAIVANIVGDWYVQPLLRSLQDLNMVAVCCNWSLCRRLQPDSMSFFFRLQHGNTSLSTIGTCT